MCVVPGDIWTCDTLSTDPTIVTRRYETADSIVPTDTSYLGYTQDPAKFSETIDSSYVIEDDTSDLTTEAATAYPLIEFDETSRMIQDDTADVRNVTYHKEENYLYEYVNNRRRVPLPLMQKYEALVNDHYKRLSELVSRLHVYQKLSSAISGSLSMTAGGTTTANPTRTIAILTTHNRKQNVSLNYLMQSYVEGNKLHNDKPVETEESGDRPQIDNDMITSTENSLQLLIDGLDSENNIIMINDNLGNRQYLTIDRYRAVARRITPRSVSVMACTRNVRLPNRTDCEKYYTCDPRTASVVEYTCPLHTAFNAHSRICDTESVKACKRHEPPSNVAFVKRVEHEDDVRDNPHEEDTKPEKEKPCNELGKMKDPTSDSHYYICYSVPGSEEIKSVRMTCPNALIFCQNKRVCTTERLCDRSR